LRTGRSIHASIYLLIYTSIHTSIHTSTHTATHTAIPHFSPNCFMAALPLLAETTLPAAAVTLGRIHARRLREVYRSAGWPCQDVPEIELLAAGMLQRICSPGGHETLRVTDMGIAWLARAAAQNRSALSKHEALVERVACEMVRAGRIAWRGLGLRARLSALDDGGAGALQNAPLHGGEEAVAPDLPARWCIARPDVFSIRNTTVEAYADPIVHEIKVHRSDLLGDLRRPDKRAAYLDLGGQCWYVLGADAKGRPIGDASEIAAECGVMLIDGGRLVVARAAPQRARKALPFALWLALAKATPVSGLTEDDQTLLGA
jgi:hypothetical protein